MYVAHNLMIILQFHVPVVSEMISNFSTSTNIFASDVFVGHRQALFPGVPSYVRSKSEGILLVITKIHQREKLLSLR